MPDVYVRTVKTDGTYALAPVIACVKNPSGHVFLIHKSISRPECFSATYGPVGLSAGNQRTIEAAIASVDRVTGDSLQRHVSDLEQQHRPLLGTEYGLEHADIWRGVEKSRFERNEYRPVPELAA